MIFLEYRDETGEAYMYVSSKESLERCIKWLRKMYQVKVVEQGKDGFTEFAFWDERKDFDKEK